MYFLTTLRVLSDGTVDDNRTVAMSSTYDKLEKLTLNNYNDICEAGYYNYAIISKLEEGFYPFSNEIQWFKMRYKAETILLGHTTIEKISERPYILKDYNLYIIG